MAAADLEEIHQFLACPTPDAWVATALANQELLLIDHANCEKKATGTALNLTYRYLDDFELLNKLSRLAREELRHFEQVIAIMRKRGVEYRQLGASRYAAGLRAAVRSHEPGRRVDTLIVGAIIEARSCERFARLAPRLDPELGDFYRSLLKSESRHYRDYLALAAKAEAASIEARVGEFLDLERELIESVDAEFRFHSGTPAPALRAAVQPPQ